MRLLLGSKLCQGTQAYQTLMLPSFEVAMEAKGNWEIVLFIANLH